MNMQLIDRFNIPATYDGGELTGVYLTTHEKYIYVVGGYSPGSSIYPKIIYAYTYDAESKVATQLASINIGDNASLIDLTMHGDKIVICTTAALRIFSFNGSSFSSVTSDTSRGYGSVVSNGTNIFTSDHHNAYPFWTYVRKWTLSGSTLAQVASINAQHVNANSMFVTDSSVGWSTSSSIVGGHGTIWACNFSLGNLQSVSTKYTGQVCASGFGNYIFHTGGTNTTGSWVAYLYMREISSSQVFSLVDYKQVPLNSVSHLNMGLSFKNSFFYKNGHVAFSVTQAEDFGTSGNTPSFRIFGFNDSAIWYDNKASYGEYTASMLGCAYCGDVDEIIFACDTDNPVNVFSYGQGYEGTNNKAIWVPGI